MKQWLIISITFLHFPYQVLCQEINSAAPDFFLKTQYDQTINYKSSDGKKTIIIIGDRKSGKQASEWSRMLKENIKDSIQYIQIAATGWVPFFAKNQVLDGFLNKPPIFIDWNNTVSAKFDYLSKKRMAIHINKSGLIKAFEKGEWTATNFNRFIDEVNK